MNFVSYLVNIENSLHIRLANPKSQVRTESARGVASKVKLRSGGAECDGRRSLVDSLLNVEAVLGGFLV
jgi:hypothetical protein